MSIQNTQKTIQEFVKEYHLETDVEARMLDLVSEIGELSKELLKGTQYGKKEFENPPDWQEEFGDVFFSLICLANSTDIDLDAALNTALTKYQSRFDHKGSIESGK